MNPAGCDAEARRTIYDQDGQFLRYRDSLKWSRFQTASAIEGAALYGAFQVAGLGPSERVILMAFSTMLVLLIFVLVVVDERDVAAHLKRIKDYEIAAGAPYPPAKRRPMLGVKTTRWVMAALLLFNVAVLVRLIRVPPLL